MLELAAGGYRLELAPERGGSVTAFTWRGKALLRSVCGPSMFDVASFPLVPFSNRIAFGRFRADDRDVRLAPNFPGSDHPHTLHGFGWMAQWQVVEAERDRVTLEHRYSSGEWPWSYAARQTFELSDEGLVMSLCVNNQGESAMPAGLGFHPYFPRDADTVYHGLHRGEWRNSVDGLPERLDKRDAAIDWWGGEPVDRRAVDTLYTDRVGPLRIDWPSRGLSMQIQPAGTLPHTVVYSPGRSDFFCVEPVSHMTDAVNMAEGGDIKWIAPGEAFTVSMTLAVIS